MIGCVNHKSTENHQLGSIRKADNLYIHNRIHTTTISFPHTTKSWLTTYISLKREQNLNFLFNTYRYPKSREKNWVMYGEIVLRRTLTLIVTFPFVIFLILKPTVGIISSEYWPDAIKLTNVVLPEFCKPTSVSSISSFQNRLLNQSKMRWTKANIAHRYLFMKSENKE